MIKDWKKDFYKIIGDVPKYSDIYINLLSNHGERKTCFTCGKPIQGDVIVKQLEDFIQSMLDDQEKEVCICAAVKWKDKIWFGHRHHNALVAMHDEISWELSRRQFQEEEEKVVQGFITTRHRFVDRSEGYKLQIAAGIKSVAKTLPYLHEELYSEDLY